VFRYSVPQDRSSYTVRYCCLNHWQSYWQIGEGHVFEAVPQYDGEIAVEPKSGSILRLTVKTAIGPPSPIYRANVLVEYGPVEIGGKSYICPVKSVSVTTAMDEVYRGSEGQGHESVAAEVQVQSAVDRPASPPSTMSCSTTITFSDPRSEFCRARKAIRPEGKPVHSELDGI